MDESIAGDGPVRSGEVPSLPSPCPRSPPEYPDLYGRRREFARVQMLEREIGFLEEELKSVEGLEPASRCCKAVVDFSLGNSDPFIQTYQKRSASCGGFWKRLCGISWLNFSWICCCCTAVCPPDLDDLRCRCSCDSCISCPECRHPNCPEWHCLNFSLLKWPRFSCCHLRLRFPECCRPSCCCRNSSCFISRIPRTCGRCPWINCSCSRCPWINCSCSRCPWINCSCGRCRPGRCFSRPKCSCGGNKCWCPELPQPCICFSCRDLCCNPCYYCY